MAFANVKEQYMLYDTVGINQVVIGVGITAPDGWFTSYNDMGQANDVPFFNVRNRTSGLMWNNQDKRDQLAWPFLVNSIGVTFWANPATAAPGLTGTSTDSPEDITSHIFANDLPRHCGVVMRVQQDDRLKTHAYFCSPGYGVCGGGYARGQATSINALGSNPIMTNNPLYDHHLAIQSQGQPTLANRFEFPLALRIPRTATMSVRLVFTEYGRQLLQQMPELGIWNQTLTANPADNDHVVMPGFSAIQVSLVGQRLVQQRGQYHR